MKLGRGKGGAPSAGMQQLVYYGGALFVVLLVFAAGYFVFVQPEKAKASRLNVQIQSVSDELIRKSAAVNTERQLAKVQVADLLDLTRAMPDSQQMADVIIQLNKLAYDSGVKFSAISPGEPVPEGSYTAIPLKITVEGSYYDLMEFLYDLRQLVSVRDVGGDGKLIASGRLFVVDKLSISLDQAGDPHRPPLRADLDLSAFVYGVQAAAPPAGTSTTTGTSTTSTTTSTTTTPAASAAGAPAGGG